MADVADDLFKEKNPPPLDEDDIALLKTYVRARLPFLGFFFHACCIFVSCFAIIGLDSVFMFSDFCMLIVVAWEWELVGDYDCGLCPYGMAFWRGYELGLERTQQLSCSLRFIV